MTSAADERGAEALRKFWILLSASFVSSLIVFGSDIVAVSLPSIGRSLKASFGCRPAGAALTVSSSSASVRLGRCARTLPQRCRVTDRLPRPALTGRPRALFRI